MFISLSIDDEYFLVQVTQLQIVEAPLATSHLGMEDYLLVE